MVQSPGLPIFRCALAGDEGYICHLCHHGIGDTYDPTIVMTNRSK